MFGLYRYALAAMVVYGHLYGFLWGLSVKYAAGYGVISFYVLSGFLMAFILNEVYGFYGGGLIRFFINRIIRIFSPYLVVLAVSLAVILALPSVARDLNDNLLFPSSVMDWVHNIAIFGLLGEDVRVVPSAWSLEVELFFYLAMALLLARNRTTTVLWLLASVVYTVYMVLAGYTFADRYMPIPAASLPFSVGAALYYLRAMLPPIPKWNVVPALLFFFTNAFAARVLWNDPITVGLYLSVAASAYVTLSLSMINTKAVRPWLAKVDRFFGDLAYPIFLCHWVVAVVVAGMIGTRSPSVGLFLGSFLLANVLAVIIHALVESQTNKIRDAVRADAKQPSATG